MAKIIIVGDLFPIKNNIDLFSMGDIQSLFGEKIVKLFSDADLRICNMEGALTDGEERCKKTGPVITAPVKAVNAYKELDIDYCMLANNHITDANNQGVVDTMLALDKVGIKHIGAGINESSISHYVIHTLADKKICIYNVCERMYNKPDNNNAGAWLYDEYIVCKELEKVKHQSDYVIVIYHGGIEKFRYPSPEIKKRFHRMTDSGADVILSQHTHCIGCEEYYNGAYLLYGQGDFLLKNFRPEITDKGLIVEIVVDERGLSVNKHMVKCSKDLCLTYLDNPDYTDFYNRSKMIKDDEFLYNEFKTFCKKELLLYLTAFKSPGKMMRFVRRFFPGPYKKWLFHNAFSRRNLLFTLHTLRSEQNRETAIVGLEDLLNI